MPQGRGRTRIQTMVVLAMLTGIIFILGLTPIGMIQIFVFKITMVHLPVIIGACMLGVKGGAFLGFLFGLISFINNSFIAPGPTSFVFSPFATTGIVNGNAWSLVIVFVPRILVGVVAAIIFQWVYKRKENAWFAGAAAGITGTLVNTTLVFLFIYLFFQKPYEQALEKSLTAVIQASVVTNFIPEAVAAMLVVPVTVQALYKLRKRR